MVSLRRVVSVVAMLVAVLGGACSRKHGQIAPPPAGDGGEDGTTDGATTEGGFPDSSIADDTLLLSRVVPDHGPAPGGNAVVLRGNGFTAEAIVYFGDVMAQPADTRLIDPGRLLVGVPAGAVGPVDVTVEVPTGEAAEDGGAPPTEEVTLPNGYHYDAFYVDPGRGSVSGGTRIAIVGTGTSFADGDTVTVGGVECRDVEVISPTRIECVVPAGTAGTEDVTVEAGDDGAELTVEDAFEYYEASDPIYGGLGGGALTGVLNVTVLDAAMGLPIPDAFVYVGEDAAGDHQGLTDLRGQIAFSGDDLVGPQTVTAAKDCFEKTSFVAFDAVDVTIFLFPLMDPRCGSGGGGGGGRGRQGAYVSGDLIWAGPNEYGPNPWFNIPEPRAGEVKVAYVATTQACAGDGIYCVNPDPTSGGGRARILEVLPTDRPDHLGYPYRIFARPAGMAVYALAGLENTTTGEFVPYVMGIARDVLAGPGEEVRGADMYMNIPLDHTVDVQLGAVPGPTPLGPDRFRVEAFLDLSGEGVLERRQPLDAERTGVARSRIPDGPFRFLAEPALFGALADGRYTLAAGWYTGDFEDYPASVVFERGVRDVAEPVALDDFLGIPVPTAPAPGGVLPADRVLRWTLDTDAPDFWIVLVVGGDGMPAWRHFVAGEVQEAPVPDLSSIPGIPDIASGFVTWGIYAVRTPDFDFDEITYRNLQEDTWDAYSMDLFVAQL